MTLKGRYTLLQKRCVLRSPSEQFELLHITLSAAKI